MFVSYLALATAITSIIQTAALPAPAHPAIRSALAPAATLEIREAAPTTTTPDDTNPTDTTTTDDGPDAAPSGPLNVVYWGQNDDERNLGEYCKDNEGIDVLVLAFVSQWGNNKPPSGNFGPCSTDQKCQDLQNDAKACQQAGKKIIISVGGAAGSGSISSQSDAEQLAQDLWDSYGNPDQAKNKQAKRPLGDVTVDGFDIDIEKNDSSKNANFKFFINKLRSLFKTDSSGKYYITGAPQCPIPEPYMGNMIRDAKFDWLFIQFYNNPDCSADNYRDGKKQNFNFDAWRDSVNEGASKGAQLFIGLPASKQASTGDDSGSKFYLKPNDMMGLVNEYKTHDSFGGVMMWDAGNSDTVKDGGCNYAQHTDSVLKKGKVCSA